ncbi:MAG TPA: PHP domain-containing protein, partial [Thermoanaerobaculia bacterium]|nr:PHP domain-containing protein [Thermoanaerobaculia bacterium]
MDGRGDGKHGGPPGRDMLGPLVGTERGKAYTGPGAHKEKLRKRAYVHPPASVRRARPYAELRAASAFSFLNGASLPEDLADTAASLDLPAMALVDANGLSGAPRFWKAAKQAGIKALVGAEVTIGSGRFAPAGGGARGARARGFASKGKRGASRAAGDAPESGASAAHSFEEILPGPLGLVPPPLSPGVSLPRLTLLVENQRGYKNLCSLLTAAAMGQPKGQAAAAWEDVAAHAEGLHVLTGGEESAVTRALVSG